jgi:cysteine desulfurase
MACSASEVLGYSVALVARLYHDFAVSATYGMMVRHMWHPFKKQRIYVDYAAATPLAPAVARLMRAFEDDVYANASGVHLEARQAHTALEEARAKIAGVLATTPHNVVFTSGGTESNNLALLGVVEKLHEGGREYADMEIVTTAIEHPSLIEPLRVLASKGVVVIHAPVAHEGRITEKDFRTLLSPKTVLVTFAYANSEIGVVQDVRALSRIVRLWRAEQKNSYPYVHIDACQAPLWLSCKMDSLGVDMMTLDAGKCYGPKGVGVLALRGDVSLTPLLRGGSQEGGLRPGTENVSLMVGCAAALHAAQLGWEERARKVTERCEFFIKKLAAAFPAMVLNGPHEGRLANNVNISIPGLDGEYAVVGLDVRGVACSTRSACKTNESLDEGGSHVLRALCLPQDVVQGAIRFSPGEQTTTRELERVVTLLLDHARVAAIPEFTHQTLSY